MIKVRTVKYNEETLSNIKKHPLARDNFENILKDFEFLYDGFLSQEFDLLEEQIAQLKGDLLTAFAMGVTNASDLNSNFRIGFRLPEELCFKKKENNSGIILPDDKIVSVPPKIITDI